VRGPNARELVVILAVAVVLASLLCGLFRWANGTRYVDRVELKNETLHYEQQLE
jgi:hypothetical protein